MRISNFCSTKVVTLFVTLAAIPLVGALPINADSPPHSYINSFPLPTGLPLRPPIDDISSPFEKREVSWTANPTVAVPTQQALTTEAPFMTLSRLRSGDGANGVWVPSTKEIRTTVFGAARMAKREAPTATPNAYHAANPENKRRNETRKGSEPRAHANTNNFGLKKVSDCDEFDKSIKKDLKGRKNGTIDLSSAIFHKLGNIEGYFSHKHFYCYQPKMIKTATATGTAAAASATRSLRLSKFQKNTSDEISNHYHENPTAHYRFSGWESLKLKMIKAATETIAPIASTTQPPARSGLWEANKNSKNYHSHVYDTGPSSLMSEGFKTASSTAATAAATAASITSPPTPMFSPENRKTNTPSHSSQHRKNLHSTRSPMDFFNTNVIHTASPTAAVAAAAAASSATPPPLGLDFGKKNYTRLDELITNEVNYKPAANVKRGVADARRAFARDEAAMEGPLQNMTSDATQARAGERHDKTSKSVGTIVYTLVVDD